MGNEFLPSDGSPVEHVAGELTMRVAGDPKLFYTATVVARRRGKGGTVVVRGFWRNDTDGRRYPQRPTYYSLQPGEEVTLCSVHKFTGT